MKAIVYTRPDGAISIVRPLISIDDPPGFTEADALARARSAIPPDAQQVRVIDDSEIPRDRRFRNAWRNDFSIDIAKARDITRARLKAKGALTPEFALAIDQATTTDQLLALEID